MAITYDELIRRTPEWMYATNRALVDEMETIVSQAHEQLINVMDHDLFRTVITGKVLTAASGGVLDLTAENPRVLEVRGFRVKWRDGIDDWTPIMRRELEMLSTLYARNRPRRPLYYAEYSNSLNLKAFPAPDRDYELEITANVEPEILSAAVQTNVIAEQASRALEKATFRQAALFMKSWDDAQAYEKEMMGAVTEINAQISRRRRDETEQRPKETVNSMGV